MDSSGFNPSRPFTRGMKRAAEREENTKHDGKRRKQNLFGSRLIPSAASGGQSILIGRNDIITDPNIPKIRVPREIEEKPEIKEEETPGEKEVNAVRSNTVFQDDLPVKDEISPEDKSDGSNQVKGFMETEEVHVQIELEVNGMREGTGLNPYLQVECIRCPDLEKNLGKRDFMIQELELKLKSKEQRIQELSKKLAEAGSLNPKAETEGDKSFEINRNTNSDLDTMNEEYTNPIFRAIWNRRSKKEIENLVKMGQDWKQEDAKGDSVLHVAARTGNLELVKYFVTLGAKVNAKNSSGSTPLMEVAKAKENFSEIVDVLVSNGANIKATNTSGENALCIALRSRKTAKEIEKVYFDADSERYHRYPGGDWLSKSYKLSLKCTADGNGDTFLHKAAASGDLEALKYFMSVRADVSVTNRKGWTPLMSAVLAKENFSSIVDLLLINGADINKTSDLPSFGILTLAIACKRPVKDIEKLMDAGARWQSRIVYDCVSNEHIEALTFFIGRGASLNARTSGGWAPILDAVCSGRREMVEFLIKNGANSLRGNNLPDSTLVNQVSRRARPIEALEALFKHGVTWDHTALHCFAERGKLEEVRYCILKGADVNSRDPNGRTPLFRAVSSYNPTLEMLEFLVEAGANVNEVDKEGFSILHHAVAYYLRSSERALAVAKNLVSLGATWSTGVVGSGPKKESILHAAVRGSCCAVVKYFISIGVEVDARDSEGETPFLRAVRRKKSEQMGEIARVLVKSGADPNVRDGDGNTALLLGVCRPTTEYARLLLPQVKLLVELGCDWKLPNKEGLTVISKLEKYDKNSSRLAFFKGLR